MAKKDQITKGLGLTDEQKLWLSVAISNKLSKQDENEVLALYGFNKEDGLRFLFELANPVKLLTDLLRLPGNELKENGGDRDELIDILRNYKLSPQPEFSQDFIKNFSRYFKDSWKEVLNDLNKTRQRPKFTKQSQNLFRLEFQASSELQPEQLCLWRGLSDRDAGELNSYKGIAEAGGLKTFQELVTDAQYRALHAVLGWATQNNYEGSNGLPIQSTETVRDIGPGYKWFVFEGWENVIRAMGKDPEAGVKTRMQAVRDFKKLEDLKVPLVVKLQDPKTKREQLFIRPAGKICEIIYAPYVTEGGKKLMNILVGIREEFTDLKAFVQFPADLDNQIQRACIKAGYERKLNTDTAFIKWLYRADANRRSHKGEVFLKTAADQLGLAHLVDSSRLTRLHDTLDRCLKVAIEGGWLLSESRIEGQKLIWKRNREMFPGSKKTTKQTPKK